MKNTTFRSHCPINYAQEVFGDRWSLLVVRDLLFKKKSYYGEFLASEEGISTNILADRLQRLEDYGIVEKHSGNEGRNRSRYSLSQKGIDLLPILLEMILWSAKYDKKTKTPPEFISQLKRNRDMVSAQVVRELAT